tara:strand:- start:1098 stop:1385 length:288 start_codon:yes stop_codon:yes gene_type:complete
LVEREAPLVLVLVVLRVLGQRYQQMEQLLGLVQEFQALGIVQNVVRLEQILQIRSEELEQRVAVAFCVIVVAAAAAAAAAVAAPSEAKRDCAHFQ